MNETAKKKTKRFATSEIVWMSIASFFIVGGLFVVILGIVGHHLPLDTTKINWIINSEDVLKAGTTLDYRAWGIIAMLLGILIAVISLNHYAKKSDLDSERNLRRKERLAANPSLGGDVASSSVVEAASSDPVPPVSK